MATPLPARTLPAPAIDPASRPFFEAAREGRLLLGRCTETGRLFFPPRPFSPFTLGPDVTTVAAGGGGTIYSLTVSRGAEPVALAVVELDEGVRLLTNIVEADGDALSIGQAVRLRWAETEDPEARLPVFAPG